MKKINYKLVMIRVIEIFMFANEEDVRLFFNGSVEVLKFRGKIGHLSP